MAINPNVTHFPAAPMSHDPNVVGRPLAKKMAEVLADVTRVPKRGRNDFHKYDYVTESDLVDHIRDKLAEKGVAIFPSVREHFTETIEDNRGRAQYLTTITLDVTLIDGESGDIMTTSWVGQGLDNADKGYYKAYTGAVKYFLMKTFMISTGDDPELDTYREAPPRRQQPQAPARQPAPKASKPAPQERPTRPANPEERQNDVMAEFGALLEESVDTATHKAFEALYVKRLGAKSLGDIDPNRVAAMCRKLRGQDATRRAQYVTGVLSENAGEEE